MRADRPASDHAADYDAWYATSRGAWLGGREVEALIRLGGIGSGTILLDVGCGSGWFTRRFGATGCAATGLDRDPAMIKYARARGGADYMQGDMLALPFPDKSFDVVTAVTALCFVDDEHKALAEMIRVARRRVVLGLLHRRSLLYLRKRGRGAYAGAHWHTRAEVEALLHSFPQLRGHKIETLLFWPGGPVAGRALEKLPWLSRRCGGFMAVGIELQASSDKLKA